jgi:hypothetical protein
VKSRIKTKLRNILFALLLMLGHTFPTTGITKECDDKYEDNDDIQMFI